MILSVPSASAFMTDFSGRARGHSGAGLDARTRVQHGAGHREQANLLVMVICVLSRKMMIVEAFARLT